LQEKLCKFLILSKYLLDAMFIKSVHLQLGIQNKKELTALNLVRTVSLV